VIYHGDCVAGLKTLPANSVHCVVTSPPYWGLRHYKTAPLVWGGNEGCAHEWSEQTHSSGGAQPSEKVRWQHTGAGPSGHPKVISNFCSSCGAWRGHLGLEPTQDLYVAHLVEVFRSVRRVLRDDGTLWLNIGDCYQSGTRGTYMRPRKVSRKSLDHHHTADLLQAPNRMPQVGLKDKDLLGIPWQLAFALRDDGWYLRSEIIWAKGLSFVEAHFATFPPDLVHPCIGAGTSERGCCARCGAPWARVVDSEPIPDDIKAAFEAARRQTADDHGRADGFTTRRPNFTRRTRDVRWMPTCTCGGYRVRSTWSRRLERHGWYRRHWQERLDRRWGEPTPCTVLDPFAGSGTVGEVCALMLRAFIGIDLNPEYCAMAERRIAAVAPLFASYVPATD
jgi:DNA modification methylase